MPAASTLRFAVRASSTSSACTSQLRSRMLEEMHNLFTKTGPSGSLPVIKPRKAGPRSSSLRRKMPEHHLPPYAEANFRHLKFVFTRAPRLADFPGDRVYRRDSLDLLFRHFYRW